MNLRPILLLVVTIAFATAVASQGLAQGQAGTSTLIASCSDAARAFNLRQDGIDGLAVADPVSAAKLRQAALLFYRCAQREADPHRHQLFMAYYANTLYRVGEAANDARATRLAIAAAGPLATSPHSDVRALVVHVVASVPTVPPSPTPTPAVVHSAAYCTQLAPTMGDALHGLDDAVAAAIDAGNNDTQALATTTARYGGAFKAVEDDFVTEQDSIERANSALSTAGGTLSDLSDAERQSAQGALQALGTVITYTDTYSRLALAFERGINGSNRQLARARVAQALAASQRNTSTTYSNGNATCSNSTYSTNCYGNSTSTTYSNNRATVAQQNAANALAQAQDGRLSYGEADTVLMQGLPLLQQIHGAVETAVQSWANACAGSP